VASAEVISTSITIPDVNGTRSTSTKELVDAGTAYVDSIDGLEELARREDDGKKEASGCWMIDHHGYVMRGMLVGSLAM